MRLAIFLIALLFAASGVGAEAPAVLQPPSPSAGELSQPEQAQPAKTNETVAPDQQRSVRGPLL
jgi:hypothetical protein